MPAYVAVDPRTGHVEVLDDVAIEDVGRILNPAIAHGQAIGGIVQGLGGAFLDHLVYDEEGQLLTASLADYLVPLATDFPNVRAVTLERHAPPSNPLGVKGAGEGGSSPSPRRWAMPSRRRWACRCAKCRSRRRASGN